MNRNSHIYKITPTLILGGISVILPFEILLLTMCIIPFLYIFLEIIRCKKESFSKIGFIKPILFLSIILIAYFIPRPENWWIHKSINNPVSIRELADKKIIRFGNKELLMYVDNIIIDLPKKKLTQNDIISAIESQTIMKVRRQRCASGATILFGPDTTPYVRIHLNEQQISDLENKNKQKQTEP